MTAEPRWPAILVLVIVYGLNALLPNRYQPAPSWFALTAISICIASMLAELLAPTSVLWRRVERVGVVALFTIICTLNILSIGRVITDMVTHEHGFGGITLLESSAAIWASNVLIFALLYWQVDGVRPKARSARGSGSDFYFAEAEDADALTGWIPHFVDYLYLAFVVSTSFSPPDYARPTSARAKVMLMLQASISLITIGLIASRAISAFS